MPVERHPLALADGRALDPGDRAAAGRPRVEVDAVEGAVTFVDDQEPPVGHRDDAGEVVGRRGERDLRGDRQRGRASAALGDLLRGEVPEHGAGPVGGPDVAGARHHEVEDLPTRSGLEATHLRFRDQVVHADLPGDRSGRVEQVARDGDPGDRLPQLAGHVHRHVGIGEPPPVDRAVVVGRDGEGAARRVPADVGRLPVVDVRQLPPVGLRERVERDRARLRRTRRRGGRAAPGDDQEGDGREDAEPPESRHLRHLIDARRDRMAPTHRPEQRRSAATPLRTTDAPHRTADAPTRRRRGCGCAGSGRRRARSRRSPAWGR